MKKKIILFLLSFACIASFSLGMAACKEQGGTDSNSTGTEDSSISDSSSGIGGDLVIPEEPEVLTDPDLQDITVYAADRPALFYIGKGNLVSLSVNGVVLTAEDYVINGGSLSLTANSWSELGEGELTFIFDFDNYDDVTITVTVSETDDTPAIPGDGLTKEENFELWTANSSLSLAYSSVEDGIVVTKTSGKDSTKAKENMLYVNVDYIRLAAERGATCIQFDYKANDALAAAQSAGFRFYATETAEMLTGGFDSFTATTEWQTATLDIEQFLVANGNVQYLGIVIGGGVNSTLTLKNWRIGTQEDLNAYRVASLLPNYGFFEENVAKWSNVNDSGVKIGWNDEKGMTLTTQMANAGLWQRYCMVYTPVTFMSIARSAGYKAISFMVTTDADFEDYVSGIVNNRDLGKGLRIVSKANDGLDNSIIENGFASGIYQYADFGGEAGITEFTVTISLEDFFALNENVKYLGMVVGAPAGTSFYLSNLQLLETLGEETPDEPDEPEVPDGPAATLQEAYGFTQVNSTTTKFGGLWDVAANGIMSLGWDATASAMKVNMVNANAAINGRYYVMYTAIDVLKEAKEAGFAGISFKVSSTDGAFTAEGKGMRVFSKQNAGLDTAGIETNAGAGIYVYNDFGTEADTTEFTVTINIAEFLALNENAAYIGYTVAIPANTSFYMSDMTFLETVEEPTEPEQPEITAEELAEKYGFTQENSTTTKYNGLWDAASSGVFGIGWDATASAMKVNMVNASAAINGRYYVMYTAIDVLKEAKEAGFISVSFKVSSTDGAFTADGKGMRVFSKQNAGLDTAGIETNAGAGIYVYNDFGTEADTTEFTVTINIAEFLALNENASYIGIVLNMAGNTNAYFSDMQFSKN